MSLLNLTDRGQSIVGGPAQFAPGLSFGETISKSYRSAVENYNSNSRTALMREVLSERNKAYEDITGSSIYSLHPSEFSTRRGMKVDQDYLDEKITALREKEPDKYGTIKTYSEIENEARRRALESKVDYDLGMEYTTGLSKYLGSFVGQAGAMFVDPIQVATATLGVGLTSSMYKAGSLIKIGLAEAAIASGAEAAIQPNIIDWQKELGSNYGLSEASVSVLAAGITGGALSAGATAISRGAIKNTYNKALNELESAAVNPNIPVKVRAGLDRAVKVLRTKEESPSPDIGRHLDNSKKATEAAIKGETLPLSEINARVLDEIDGLPSQAFDFLSPEKVYPVPVTGRAPGSAIVSYADTPVSKMTEEQLRFVVKRELLPAIRRELLADYDSEARKLGVAIKSSLQTQLDQLKKQIKPLKDVTNRKKMASKAYQKRDEIGASTDRLKEIKRKGKAERDQINLSHDLRISHINREIKRISNKLERLAAQAERKSVAKQLQKGIVPTGDGYTAVRVRETLDKVSRAALERNKMLRTSHTAAKVQAMSKELVDSGVLPKQLKSIDELEQIIKDTDTELAEIQAQYKMEIDEIGDDFVFIDSDGTKFTKEQWAKRFEVDENELSAMRSCANGGAK